MAPATGKGRWVKGQSGNPRGTNKAAANLQQLAREASPEGLKAVLRVLRSKKTPASAVVAAAVALWDRGFGKPTQPVQGLGLDKLVEVLERRRKRSGG